MSVPKMPGQPEAAPPQPMPVQVTTGVLIHPTLSLAARGLYAVVAATRDQPDAQSVLDALPVTTQSELLTELITAGYARVNDLGDVVVGDGGSCEAVPVRSELDCTGWAYAISGGAGGMVKIGTSGDVAKRLRTLQTSSPQLLTVLWRRQGGIALEMHLHDAFASRRVRGEWFDFTGVDAVSLITEAAQSFWDAQ